MLISIVFFKLVDAEGIWLGAVSTILIALFFCSFYSYFLVLDVVVGANTAGPKDDLL